jgi:hypothetical protein
VKEFIVDAMLSQPVHNTNARSVAFSFDGKNVLAGTKSSEIIEISVIDGKSVGNNKGK